MNSEEIFRAAKTIGSFPTPETIDPIVEYTLRSIDAHGFVRNPPRVPRELIHAAALKIKNESLAHDGVMKGRFRVSPRGRAWLKKREGLQGTTESS